MQQSDLTSTCAAMANRHESAAGRRAGGVAPSWSRYPVRRFGGERIRGPKVSRFTAAQGAGAASALPRSA